jgi:hypothetical protein
LKICLSEVLLAFVLLGAVWLSWVCGLASDANLGKYPVVLLFQMFFLFLSLFLFQVILPLY